MSWHYDEITSLSNIYLEDSFVLGITARPTVVEFAMDFVLTPGHPAYSIPPHGDSYCFANGLLRFEQVTRLMWTDQGSAPATDATGEVDWGSVDTFTHDEGVFSLSGGDWGAIQITSTEPFVRLDDDSTR